MIHEPIAVAHLGKTQKAIQGLYKISFKKNASEIHHVIEEKKHLTTLGLYTVFEIKGLLLLKSNGTILEISGLYRTKFRKLWEEYSFLGSHYAYCLLSIVLGYLKPDLCVPSLGFSGVKNGAIILVLYP
mgnify:CR=1 FL=1